MRNAWLVVAVLGCESSPSEPPDNPDAAAPVTGEDLVVGLTDPTSLAVDGTHLYVVEAGRDIARAPKTGGAVTAIATAQRGPTSLDATTERLCWVNSGTHSQDFLDGSIRCAPKAGGADVELSTSYFPSGLAIDGAIYWVEIDGQKLRAVGLDGTDPRTLDASSTSKTNIAISPAYVAWTASGDQADVVRMDRATSTFTTLSTSDYAPGAIRIDGDTVYWVTHHALSDNGAIRMWRDGAVSDLVAEEPWPSQLVLAGGALYWTSNGRIRMYDGSVTTLVAGRGTIGGLVSDGEYLYWSEPDRGAIVRLRRGSGSGSP